MDATILATLATDLLAACTDAYGQVPDAGQPPDRRYVTHGPATATCDQLTVAVTNLKAAAPFPTTQIKPIDKTAVLAAELTVEVYRSCWPTVDLGPSHAALPDPAALTDAARLLAMDAATIGLWVAALAARGTLFPSVDGTIGVGDTALGPMLPQPPTGTVAGWKWTLSAKLAIP